MNSSMRSNISHKPVNSSHFNLKASKDFYATGPVSVPFSSTVSRKTQSLFKELNTLNSQNKVAWKRVQESSVNVFYLIFSVKFLTRCLYIVLSKQVQDKLIESQENMRNRENLFLSKISSLKKVSKAKVNDYIQLYQNYEYISRSLQITILT